MSCHCSNLGDDQTDIIIANILDTAREIWPERTAQAEDWINSQAASYGISYAKYQAERASMTVYPWLQSPITWIVGAYILYRILK